MLTLFELIEKCLILEPDSFVDDGSESIMSKETF